MFLWLTTLPELQKSLAQDSSCRKERQKLLAHWKRILYEDWLSELESLLDRFERGVQVHALHNVFPLASLRIADMPWVVP